ncbi:MAG: hypothetical protein ABFD97_10020 [Syntrophobacter sp.]
MDTNISLPNIEESRAGLLAIPEPYAYGIRLTEMLFILEPWN